MGGVLSPEGRYWIKELVEHIKEDTHRYTVRNEVDEKYWDLNWIDEGNLVVLELPETDSQDNLLIENPNSKYILKIRNPLSLDNPPNQRKATTYPYYVNEIFGEVRIWLEANRRGYPELFAKITDWDQSRAHWLVQEKAEPIEHGFYDPELQRKLKNRLWGQNNWYIADEEIGKIGKRTVYIDFGEFWLNDDWLVAENDVIDDTYL